MLLPTGNRRVAVVVPCLNESEPIGGVVREILSQGVDDVIVVDNGSTDGTAGEAAAAGATVVSEPKRGYGRACAAGYRQRSCGPEASAEANRLFRPAVGSRTSLWYLAWVRNGRSG